MLLNGPDNSQKIASSRGGSRPHIIHGSWAHMIQPPPNGISIGSSNTQTQITLRVRSVAIGLIYAIHAMWPNNNSRNRRVPLCETHFHKVLTQQQFQLEKKLSSVEDRGQTDRVTTPSTIEKFLKFEILTAIADQRVNMCHHAKLHTDQSNRCGNMANFSNGFWGLTLTLTDDLDYQFR